MQTFEHRGLVEGYYGPPCSHEGRLAWIDRLARWGMNRYVHAPKDDPLHRGDWRTPYPADEMRRFGDWVERARTRDVEVGFAVSPGLSIEYSKAADVRALCEKLLAFRELGARFFSLALDDVPTHLAHDADRRAFASLADAHVALAHAVREALGEDTTIWLVPTDYTGIETTDYLDTLGGDLDPSIEVGWTGRTVVSPSIRTSEAATRSAALRRRLLVWDNVPVTDGPMRTLLHLGPYLGRDADLARHASGILLNPMQHPCASALMVHTAAAYLRDPAGFDPERAWEEAVAELGAGAAGALRTVALAHRFSAQDPGDRDRELEGLFAGLRAAPDSLAAVERLGAAVDARLEANARVREELADRALAAELEPWLETHRAETERMRAAADLLEALASGATGMACVTAFFRFEGRLTRTPPGALVSYGPRRAVYPQLVSMRDDEAGFGADPALFLDRCLGDEIVRFAESRALSRLGGGHAVA